jgi:cytoskeletal protein RodZ
MQPLCVSIPAIILGFVVIFILSNSRRPIYDPVMPGEDPLSQGREGWRDRANELRSSRRKRWMLFWGGFSVILLLGSLAWVPMSKGLAAMQPTATATIIVPTGTPISIPSPIETVTLTPRATGTPTQTPTPSSTSTRQPTATNAPTQTPWKVYYPVTVVVTKIRVIKIIITATPGPTQTPWIVTATFTPTPTSTPVILP